MVYGASIDVIVGASLSVDSVVAALKDVASEWKRVGKELYVPDATLHLIKSEYASPMERLRVVVIYWFLKDPYISWRRLIWSLGKAKDCNLTKIADSLRGNAEELTGQCFANSGHFPVDFSTNY